MKCEQCRYWAGLSSKVVDLDAAGECRRHAPRPQDAAYERLGVRTMWPATCRTDWCWEFAVAPGRPAWVVDIMGQPKEAA